MAKKYLDKNVYEAAVERLEFLFHDFKKIYVCFSGGKDSGVLLNITIDVARRNHRKVGMLFIDLEAFYQKTIDFVESMIRENMDVLEPYWVCLPMESPNSSSYLEPTWKWWDEEKKSIWVRKMPKNPWVLNLKNHQFDFYKQNMPFESFVKRFGDWYGQGEKTACLVGIRTNESLNRFRAVTCEKKTYKGIIYSTKYSKNTYNFYPLYDWRTEDIWIYNGKFDKNYNKLYDLFYKANVSIHKMRVDEPFGNEAKAGLNLFKVIEPKTWVRVVNRVSGANFGSIYCNNKIVKTNYELPKNHTWKSFCKFLLATLPEETAAHYKEKFIKFIRYWSRTGCPLNQKSIEILENRYSDAIVNTHHIGKRGKKDKEVVRFRYIVDEIKELDTKYDVLTWKRMAMCIIKNDYICRSLSFSYTKNCTLRQKRLLEKYRNL